MEGQRFTDENVPPISDTHRRWVLGVFILFSIITFFVGALALAHGFFGETIQKRKEAIAQLKAQGFDYTLLLDQEEANRIEILQQKRTDTDGDGINDYDEKSIYKTSMYLFDSDSDGVSDFDEITAGNDPNCNERRINCLEPTQQELAQNEQLVKEVQEVQDSSQDIQEALKKELELQLNAGLNPTQLRTLLVQRGFPPESVAALRDEDLELIIRTFAGGNITPQNLDVINQSLTELDLLALDPARIRDLLTQLGLPTEALSLMSDQDLFALYTSTLKDLTANNVNEFIVSGQLPFTNETGL